MAACTRCAAYRFRFHAGEILALIGPNGAGKSTCFNMLNGQTVPDAGRVRCSARTRTGLKPRQVWRLGVGRTFQITATFPTMTVRENVQVALVFVRSASCSISHPRCRDTRGKKRIACSTSSAWAALRCGPAANSPMAISSGWNWRSRSPTSQSCFLMDEPTAGMAPRERIELMRLTAQIAREKSIGVLFTEHDMDVVFEHADRILVLNRGSLIAEGSPEEVRRNRGSARHLSRRGPCLRRPPSRGAPA